MAISARRRIVIVDDHPITRYGLVHLINGEPDLLVSGEADTADQAFTYLRPPLPDLVVVDISMPGRNVMEFIKDLHTLHPGLPVLVLSVHDESVYGERMIRAGALGYIMKREGGAVLLQAMRQVLRGEPYLSAAMSAQMFETLGGRRSVSGYPSINKLTDREFEVYQLLGEGKTNREVAQQLDISPKTVEAHRVSLSRKLSLTTPAQLIRHAVLHRQSGMEGR